MTGATVASPPPKKRRRWLRALVWIVGVLVVLLVVVYFVATSSAFVKGVILPRVSAALNADVTVSDASIHPFKEVVLRDLKVQPKGQEPLLIAPEVRVRYNLFDIIGGNIHVDEIALVSPTVQLVENPDGSKNLDPILKAQEKKPAEEKPAQLSKPSKPAQIDLQKLTLSNATILSIKNYAGGNRDITELTNVNVTVDGVKNGQTGKLQLSAEIRIENNPPAPGTNGLLAATLNGNFSFALTPDLKPASVNGSTHLDVTQTGGSYSDLATLGAALDYEVTPTEIKQVALRFQKGGASLGQLLISGPFDAEKTEGRLNVELSGIDKQVLNLAGAKSGIDFGPTTINSTNQIQLTKSGTMIVITGEFNVNKLQLTRAQQTTPSLDVRAGYDVAVDNAAKSALLRALNLTGTQNGNPLLNGQLTSPMTVSWGNSSNEMGNASLVLTVTNLNLVDWKPFIGDLVSSGTVGMKMELVSSGGGKQLAFDLSSEIANLSASLGSNQISQADITLAARGQAADLKQFNLSDYKLQLAQQNQPVFTVSGSGTYDAASQTADMQVALDATLSRLLALLAQPDLTASSGTIALKGRVTQKQNVQSVTGNFALADFTGRLGKTELRAFGTEADLDINKTPQQIEIRKADGKLTQAGNAGGSFELSGTYDLTSKTAQLTAKLADFNQTGLGPFLQPMLADKKLVSVAINGDASVQYNPNGDSALKADMQVTNLVVSDPKQQIPATPLEAKLQADATLHKQSADVRQFQITLTPTDRAQNQVQLQGHVDFSQTNAIQGNLKLAADSLDVTRYYDLFASKSQAAEKKPGTAVPETAPPASAPVSANQELAPIKLPLQNFTADANIGRLYLHEVEITNLQATVKIDGSHVVAKPLQLVLNGAPVNASADVDLSVPGYKYDVAFDADQIPFAPLVDTFQPDRKGQIGGSLSAHTQISGTGTTGASLQKTLSGKFDVGTTNMNFSVLNVRSALLKGVINVVTMVPELLRNPEGAVGTLFSGITGHGSLTDELNKSPIDVITARGTAGSGRIDLQQAVVRSPAFEADAQGTITIAEVLTNSAIQIPVSISLGQPVAERIGFATANSTNGYVKLPDFLTMTGTLGKPDKKINTLALAGGALKGIGGIIPSTGQKAGGLIQNLGGLLTGRTPGTNTSSTNQPATNKSPVNNLLNRFLGPKP